MAKIKKIKINNELVYDLSKYIPKNQPKLYIDKITENGIVRGKDGRFFRMYETEINSDCSFDSISDLSSKYNLKVSIYILNEKYYLLVEGKYNNIENAINNFRELDNVIRHDMCETYQFISPLNGNRLLTIVNMYYCLDTNIENIELNINAFDKLFSYEYEINDNENDYIKKNFNVYELLYIQSYSNDYNKINELSKELKKHTEHIKCLKLEITYINSGDKNNLTDECYLDSNSQKNIIDEMYNFSYKTDKDFEDKNKATENYLLGFSFILVDSSETELKSRIEALEVSCNYADCVLGKTYITKGIREKVMNIVPIECENNGIGYERIVEKSIAETVFKYTCKGGR